MKFIAYLHNLLTNVDRHCDQTLERWKLLQEVATAAEELRFLSQARFVRSKAHKSFRLVYDVTVNSDHHAISVFRNCSAAMCVLKKDNIHIFDSFLII